MTLKDISVPLRRALTLTLQHLPVLCWEGGGWRVESGVGWCEPLGRTAEYPQFPRQPVTQLSLTFSMCLCLPPHTVITSLNAVSCSVVLEHSNPTVTSSAFSGVSVFAFCYVKMKRGRLALHFLHRVVGGSVSVGSGPGNVITPK